MKRAQETEANRNEVENTERNKPQKARNRSITAARISNYLLLLPRCCLLLLFVLASC